MNNIYLLSSLPLGGEGYAEGYAKGYAVGSGGKSYYYPFPLEQMKKDLLGCSGVYLVKNEINGDCYIGSAISKTIKSNRLYIRFRNHFFNIDKLTNVYLRRAMIKYGTSNFSYHILAISEIDKVRELETLFISQISPKYNILQFGTSSSGYSHTEEIKKMSESYSEERRNRIKFLNKRKKFSSETIEKIRQVALLRDKTTRTSLGPCGRGLVAPALAAQPITSKKVWIYDGTTNNLIKTLPSAIQVSREYPIHYRAVRKYLKSGLVNKKLNIRIKYCS